jgi:hypothetical protein
MLWIQRKVEVKMEDERRQHSRVEWIDSGTIDLGNDMPARPCVVNNLSNGGAKLSGVNAENLRVYIVSNGSQEFGTQVSGYLA